MKTIFNLRLKRSMTSQKGASIIAVIAIMLILAVMGAALVSLVTTGSDVSVNQLQSEQALYIADGGLQYVLKYNNYPNYSTNGNWTPLGAGRFKVDTPAYVTPGINASVTTIPVVFEPTATFPSSGLILIDSELISYTGTTSSSFTGATRGAGGTTATTHSDGSSVYPAARLKTGLNANCNSTPIDIVDTDNPGGFQIPGVIFIDNEYFYCQGTSPPPDYQFTNCVRCYMGTSGAAHPATPPQPRFASQFILKSTGQVTNILSSNAQRVVKVNALPQ